ncbi:MAG: hypothetical protein UR73_C0015G0007 [candidate division WS6 bacterium GW2011_GWF1_35_23]|uniref:Uncharacterized protein n=1 Tax=candidate division WS6 bacterium GW2011_GWF1_35_23 TaxID=1619097 RepID=A0A0G0C7F7_9BACT|nr:MAG: hypothetical protein UR73_C0015G0007 [candidate division WS6 bacterium GW2011_GWF1_35_23]
MKIFKSLLTLSSVFLSSPVLAAQSDPMEGTPSSSLPPKLSALFAESGILDRIFAIIFPLAGLICVVFIIIAGYMWMSAAGDPSKIKTAQGTLTWAIIGLVVVLLTVAILQVIIKFIS